MSTKKPSPVHSSSNPALPDDLLLSCFARISRLYYPTLSLVSKRFRSLLASPELYKMRSLLGQTENFLHVCLQFYPDLNTRWFILYPKPDRILRNKKKKSSGYVLATLPIPNLPPMHSSTLVAVGSSIYMLGGSNYKAPLSKVSILDCGSYTWREGPSMRVERYWSAANVLDGKIYVSGGCDDSSNWMEVFDTKTKTWEPVLNPLIEKCDSHVSQSAVIDDEIYMYGYWGVAYKPKEDRWKDLEEFGLNFGWGESTSCVIDNILYCYHVWRGGLTWYDSNIKDWLPLKGLKRLPKFGDGYVQLANHGGKMVILWGKSVPSNGDRMISCAVIALERRTSGEIWGQVEWYDDVLTVSGSYQFLCALDATV